MDILVSSADLDRGSLEARITSYAYDSQVHNHVNHIMWITIHGMIHQFGTPLGWRAPQDVLNHIIPSTTSFCFQHDSLVWHPAELESPVGCFKTTSFLPPHHPVSKMIHQFGNPLSWRAQLDVLKPHHSLYYLLPLVSESELHHKIQYPI